MCGIGGAIQLRGEPISGLQRRLQIMNHLQAHRGPDGQGTWAHDGERVGFAHRRLSILDLTDEASQPMRDAGGNTVTYNGEIYNFIELRDELGRGQFRTTSDTEVILAAYRKWGADCVSHFRGMFAFALWDEQRQRLFCARDRFGIKPFYYTIVADTLYFASEIKALLPFVPDVATDLEGVKDYLAFQLCLDGKTLFRGIRELPPGFALTVTNGVIDLRRYWQVYYTIDFDHTQKFFEERLRDLVQDSVRLHLRSDVPIGAYISGGVDSGIVAAMASELSSEPLTGFTGKYSLGPEYDESHYARALAHERGITLHELEITADDFVDNIRKVIYHLDYPVAGPGSFSQYMVSGLAAQHRKVVLGGQGGDEIFGGYTRYLIAYFEQCIRAAIDGRAHNGNFIVTYESIIPNLVSLKNYKPMLQEFWRFGLFDDMDKRYFHLINRAPQLGSEVRWELLDGYHPYESFRQIFNGDNVGKESYFDMMTHFDFKTLLPALLHVEDRVSMAHGLEARVPLLDHPVVEFAATAPSNVKFLNGEMKHLLRSALGHTLPKAILDRKDKMGFPTPVTQWAKGDARAFVMDVLSSSAALSRDLFDNRKVLERLDAEPKFGRNLWGLLSLELWQQEFHDKSVRYQQLLHTSTFSEVSI